MAINPNRPVITYENVAVFQSDTPAHSGASNSGQNLSFLPLVQGVNFSIDVARTNVGALGTKDFIDQSNRSAPDVKFTINTIENFGDLFSSLVSGAGVRGNLNIDRNFYAVINDKKAFDISRENLYSKNTIGVGNCFLNNVNIGQSVNGMLSSQYDFVASNLQVKDLDYKTIYFQDYESLPLGSLANSPNTDPIEQLHDSLGIITVTEVGGGQDSIVVTESTLGMPGTKSLRLSDSAGFTSFDHSLSGFPVDTDYIISGTYRNDNLSNPGIFRVQFVNDGAINEVFTGDSTVASAFLGSGRLKPTDSEIRLKFPGVNDTEQQAVYISDITIKAVTGFQITAPSLDLTGDNQPQDMVANFDDMSSYYTGDASGIIPSYNTNISISGSGSLGNFLIKSDSIQSFDLSLPVNRKTIYSLGKKYPVKRKALFPLAGSFNFSNLVSSFELSGPRSNLKEFLNSDEDYSIDIACESLRGDRFDFQIQKAKLTSQSQESAIGSKASADLGFSFELNNLKKFGLLERFQGASLAYSLRNISSAYTGNVVEVRRSSDDFVKSFTAAEVTNGTLVDFVGGSNLIRQSQNFDDGLWGTLGLDKSQWENATVAPDGTDTAYEIKEDNAFGRHRVFQSSIPLTLGKTYTFSCYVKKKSDNRFLFLNTDATISSVVSVNLDTMTSTNSAAVITDEGNGWHRVSISGTCRLASGTVFYQIQNTVNADIEYQGDGSSFYLWGAQAVEGSVVRDYTKTESSMSGEGTVSKWYDQSLNANHATQTTPTKQPKIVTNGILNPDGIKFDGIDDLLDIGGAGIGEIGIQETDPLSIYTVQIPSENAILGDNSNRYLSFRASNALYYLSKQALGFYFAPSVPSTELSLFSTNHGGEGTTSLVQVYANGIAATTTDPDQGTSNANTAASCIEYIGANIGNNHQKYFEKSVAEIIIYKSDQSANRIAIEKDIKNYYKIN